MPDFPMISQAQCRRSLELGAMLLDVRKPAEYAGGHLPGSISVPLERLATAIPSLAPDQGQPLLLYCTSGQRSRTAAQVLRRLGYAKLYIVIP